MEEYSVKFNDKKVVYTDINKPWRFKTSDKKDYSPGIILVKSDVVEGKVKFSLYQYENSSGCVSARRLCFSDEKNVVFFLDVINSDEDICVYTDFFINNSDLSASCNIADKNKLVIRNTGCGLKHFRLHSEIDGNSILEKTGLMMPVSIKENGDIVYSMYDGLYSFGKKHINCFGLSSETLDKIVYWHLKGTERGYLAEAPSQSGGMEIEILGDCVNIYDYKTGECLINVKL